MLTALDGPMATLESVDDTSQARRRDTSASIAQSTASPVPEAPSPRSRVSSASSMDALDHTSTPTAPSHAVLLLPVDVPEPVAAVIGDPEASAAAIVRASVLQPRQSYASLPVLPAQQQQSELMEAPVQCRVEVVR